jgi:PAS domain S-box-containing protein
LFCHSVRLIWPIRSKRLGCSDPGKNTTEKHVQKKEKRHASCKALISAAILVFLNYTEVGAVFRPTGSAEKRPWHHVQFLFHSFYMKQIAVKYSVLYIGYSVLLVAASSYLALVIIPDTTPTLVRELVRGLFLIGSFALLFYLFTLRVNKQVMESTNQYKRLFEENPNPMWVYELDTLKILAVNQAAVQTYGYSPEEFLELSLKELRPKTEEQKLLDNVKQESSPYSNSGTWLHKRKNGEEFFVSIFSHRTRFNNTPARLVLALDINDRLVAEKRILAQNEKLREIAHLQSHNVRRPVASILGLISLFDKHNLQNEMNGIVIEKLDLVSKELDTTIHQIVEKTYELEVENQQ